MTEDQKELLYYALHLLEEVPELIYEIPTDQKLRTLIHVKQTLTKLKQITEREECQRK